MTSQRWSGVWQTEVYADWFKELRDRNARVRIKLVYNGWSRATPGT